MARFREIKSLNPKLKQSEIAKELGCSTSTLQRYRQDLNMISPDRNPSNTKENKRFQIVKMISKDLNSPQKNPLQILKRLNVRKTN